MKHYITSIAWFELKLLLKNINNVVVFFTFLLSCVFLFAYGVPDYNNLDRQVSAIIIQITLYLSVFIYAGKILLYDKQIGLLDIVSLGRLKTFIVTKIWIFSSSLIIISGIMMPFLALLLDLNLVQLERLIIANIFLMPIIVHFLALTNAMFCYGNNQGSLGLGMIINVPFIIPTILVGQYFVYSGNYNLLWILTGVLMITSLLCSSGVIWIIRNLKS